MSKGKSKTDLVVILLDIVIILLVFYIIGVGQMLKFNLELTKQHGSFVQEAEMLSFELDNNDYVSMIRGKYINEYNGEKESKSYHALADYVEAASKYKIYDNKGYTDRAKVQKDIMDKARTKMGELKLFADRVDKMFGVE